MRKYVGNFSDFKLLENINPVKYNKGLQLDAATDKQTDILYGPDDNFNVVIKIGGKKAHDYWNKEFLKDNIKVSHGEYQPKIDNYFIMIPLSKHAAKRYNITLVSIGGTKYPYIYKESGDDVAIFDFLNIIKQFTDLEKFILKNTTLFKGLNSTVNPVDLGIKTNCLNIMYAHNSKKVENDAGSYMIMNKSIPVYKSYIKTLLGNSRILMDTNTFRDYLIKASTGTGMKFPFINFSDISKVKHPLLIKFVDNIYVIDYNDSLGGENDKIDKFGITKDNWNYIKGDTLSRNGLSVLDSVYKTPNITDIYDTIEETCTHKISLDAEQLFYTVMISHFPELFEKYEKDLSGKNLEKFKTELAASRFGLFDN